MDGIEKNKIKTTDAHSPVHTPPDPSSPTRGNSAEETEEEGQHLRWYLIITKTLILSP